MSLTSTEKKKVAVAASEVTRNMAAFLKKLPADTKSAIKQEVKPRVVTPSMLYDQKDKKKKVSSTFLDVEAERDDDEQDDEDDDVENSEDRAFIKPDDERQSDSDSPDESEPSSSNDEADTVDGTEAPKKKKKRLRKASALHPFHAQRQEEEEAFMKMAEQADEAFDEDGRNEQTSSILQATGLKKSSLNKIRDVSVEEDEEEDETAKEAERLLAEKEFDKILGDEDVDDEVEEAKELEEARLQQKKPTLDASNDEDANEGNQAIVKQRGGHQKEKIETLSGRVNTELANEFLEAKDALLNNEGAQPIKGHVNTIHFDDLSDEEDKQELAPVVEPPTKKVLRFSIGGSSTSSLKTAAMVDRTRIAEEQIPAINKLLLAQTMRRSSKIAASEIRAVVAAVYTAISAGIVNGQPLPLSPSMASAANKLGTTAEALKRIEQLLKPFVDKMDKLFEETSEQYDMESSTFASKLASLFLLTHYAKMRLVPRVTAAKNCHCALTGKVIAAGSLMNYLIVLCDKVPFTGSAQPSAHTLHLPIALNTVITPVVTAMQAQKSGAPEAQQDNNDDDDNGDIGLIMPDDDDAMDIDVPVPTDPKARLLEGYDGILIKNVGALEHAAHLVTTYTRTHPDFVAWKSSSPVKPVSNFDPVSHMPRLELDWVLIVTAGVFDHLFEWMPDVRTRANEMTRCGPTSVLYTQGYDGDAKKLGELTKNLNVDFFLALYKQLEAKTVEAATNPKSPLHLKDFKNPAILLMTQRLTNEDAALKPFLAIVGNDKKPVEPHKYNVGRQAFFTRLMAQLLGV